MIRVAIISDLHADLGALDAALTRARTSAATWSCAQAI